MKKLKQNSRRKFIKNSVAASAVFGFSDFFPFDTIAEPGKRASQTTPWVTWNS